MKRCLYLTRANYIFIQIYDLSLDHHSTEKVRE